MTINKSAPTSFKLDFPLIPETNTIDEQQNFTLHIFGTILPSITLGVSEVPYNGQNLPFSDGTVEFGNWNASFHIDEEWNSYLTIYNWMQSITNGYDFFGTGRLDYSIDAILSILDNYQSSTLQFVIKNIWPYALSEVSFSYKENQSYLTADVSFTYDYFFKR